MQKLFLPSRDEKGRSSTYRLFVFPASIVRILELKEKRWKEEKQKKFQEKLAKVLEAEARIVEVRLQIMQQRSLEAVGCFDKTLCKSLIVFHAILFIHFGAAFSECIQQSAVQSLVIKLDW